MTTSGFSVDNIKIMIAEGNAELRNIMKNYLKIEGYYNLTVTENGRSAWAKLRLASVDLLITETELPEFSGMDLLAAIRADKSLKTMPVLLLASEVKHEVVAKAAELGVSGYLVKPFSHQTLADKVDKIFKRRFSPSISFVTSMEGDKLVEDGNLEGALAKFKEAASATKVSMASLHFKIGGVHEQMENDPDAEESYHEAVGMSNLHVDSYDALGRLSLKKGDTKEAAVHLKRSVEISPLDAQRQFKLGEAFLESDDFEEAEKAFKSSLKMDPRQTHIFNRLGISLRRQKKFEESLKFFQRALDVTTDDENLYFNAALVLFTMGKKDLMKDMIDKALELKPDFAEARELLERATD